MDVTSKSSQLKQLVHVADGFANASAIYTRFAAPGRVNLIGEHTDYSGGLVMPAAIDFRTVASIRASTDGHVRVRSRNLAAEVEYPAPPGEPSRDWTDYPMGVAWSLAEEGIKLPGFELELSGDVPLGAGLSSSASVTVSTALAMLWLAGRKMTTIEIVRVCQRAENRFVGAMSGIMDPFVACAGCRDHALMLDCRSLDFRLLPIPAHVRLVIANSMVKHALAGGEYNQRRHEIEEGTRILGEANPAIRSLRDASEQDLERCRSRLTETVLRRCRHVISENRRVEQAAAALDRHDLDAFGELMLEAHQSIRDDFEASAPELDLLVELATKLPGCYGARMTGGGFGGCTVNLVDASRAEAFRDKLHLAYQEETGIDAEIYLCRASAGAGPA